MGQFAAACAKPAFTQQIFVSAAEVAVVIVDGDGDSMARTDESPCFKVGVVTIDERSVEIKNGGVGVHERLNSDQAVCGSVAAAWIERAAASISVADTSRCVTMRTRRGPIGIAAT